MVHKSSSAATIATAVAALLAVAIPIALAIHLAARQARAVEMQRVAGWAESVLDRSEIAAEQIGRAVDELAHQVSVDPCSPANIALMRRHVLRSQYLKAVGHVEGDQMICSSFGGGIAQDLALGPVDPEWISPSGARVRPSVNFSFDPGRDYLVTEVDGYAAVVNRDLAIDLALAHDVGGLDASLATFSIFNGRLLVSRGTVEPEWIEVRGDLPGERSVTTFINDGHVVAVAVSSRWYIGAVAALPLGYVAAHTRATATILLPAGAVAGLLLAAAMFYWRRQQTAMPSILRVALKRQEFSLRYQPVVDLTTGRWVGAEALLRWQRADGENVPQDLFISAAENVGMIRDITVRVLELAARDLRGAVAHHPDLHVAINLSGKDLEADADVVASLRALVRRAGIPAPNLLVEISERSLLASDSTRSVLDAIRAEGIRVAIDDFGTGYSNLAHLANFKLDYLKIDKLFVDSMRSDGATSSVVPHIVEMAKSLNLQVIAEGVETAEQAQFLQLLGVHYAQGWLFGKPMPVDELLRGYAAAQHGVDPATPCWRPRARSGA